MSGEAVGSNVEEGDSHGAKWYKAGRLPSYGKVWGGFVGPPFFREEEWRVIHSNRGPRDSSEEMALETDVQ